MASQAVRISADADKYTLPAPAGFSGPGQSYTICLWAYPIYEGYYSIIWAMDNGTVDEYLWLGIWYDGYQMKMGSYSYGGLDGPNPPPFDEWIFLAVTHTSAGFVGGQGDNCLYWAHPGDTSFNTDRGAGVADAVPSHVLHLGGTGVDDPFGSWFNGRICAVKMWEAELDEAELLGEMQSYQPTRLPDLWANWTFWNGPQTVDESGNGHTLTAGTAPTAATGPPGITLNPPAGFRVGGIFDDQNGATTTDLATDGYTELEWSIRAVPPAAQGDVYEFRVHADDTPLDTYASTPQLELTTSIAFIYYGTTPIHAAYHGDTATPPFAIHYG